MKEQLRKSSHSNRGRKTNNGGCCGDCGSGGGCDGSGRRRCSGTTLDRLPSTTLSQPPLATWPVNFMRDARGGAPSERTTTRSPFITSKKAWQLRKKPPWWRRNVQRDRQETPTQAESRAARCDAQCVERAHTSNRGKVAFETSQRPRTTSGHGRAPANSGYVLSLARRASAKAAPAVLQTIIAPSFGQRCVATLTLSSLPYLAPPSTRPRQRTCSRVQVHAACKGPARACKCMPHAGSCPRPQGFWARPPKR